MREMPAFAPDDGAVPLPAVSADIQLQLVDALYRFGAGQDLGNRGLFASAFTADAVLDFSAPARRFGLALPAFIGRDAITATVFAAIADLATTHTVTNPRVLRFAGDQATLFALVEAQHVAREENPRHLLLKNIYTTDLVLDAGLWRIRHLHIDCVWHIGTAQLLFPAAPLPGEGGPAHVQAV